jgi:septin family protein
MIFYEFFESLTYSIQYEKYKCTRLQSERNLGGQRGTKISKNGAEQRWPASAMVARIAVQERREKRGREKEREERKRERKPPEA